MLYKTEVDTSMAASYEHVSSLFPATQMLLESNFAEQLQAWVAQCHEQQDYVMFAVDDVLFCDHLDLSKVMEIMEMDPTIYCFHAKLHPAISYCHPAKKSSVVPRTFQRVIGTRLLLYDRSGCTLDWNYPWDLCCTTYRSKDVYACLEQLSKEGKGGEREGIGLTHPNLLESEGARLMSRDEQQQQQQQQQQLLQGATKCCCPDSCVMVVVTINRVQSIFQNPVYSLSDGGKEKEKEMETEGTDERKGMEGAEGAEGTEGTEENLEEKGDVDAIETMFVANREIELDDNQYHQETFNSVHVGNWYVRSSDGREENDVNTICHLPT